MEYTKSRKLSGKHIWDINELHKRCEEEKQREILFYIDNDDMIYPDFNPYYFAYDGDKLVGYIAAFAVDGYVMYIYPLIDGDRAIFDKLFDMLSYEFKYYKFETMAFPMREDDEEYRELVKSLGGYEYGKEYVMSLIISSANAYELANDENNTHHFLKKSKKEKLFLHICEEEFGEYYILAEKRFGGLTREIGEVKVSYDGDTACFSEVEITSSIRNLGFGAAMMEMVINKLKEKGISKVILQVSGNNKAACALYNKCGFEISDTLLYMYVDEKQVY